MPFMIVLTVLVAMPAVSALSQVLRPPDELRIAVVVPRSIATSPGAGAVLAVMHDEARALFSSIPPDVAVEPEWVEIAPYLPGGDYRHHMAMSLARSLMYLGHEQDLRWLAGIDTSTVTSDAIALASVAERRRMRYVIAISGLRIHDDDGDTTMSGRVVMYDAEQRRTIVDERIISDTKNQGFMYACSPGTFECLFINSARLMNGFIVPALIERDVTAQKTAEISAERRAVLERLYTGSGAPAWVQALLDTTDFGTRGEPFGVLVSPESDKFIVFIQDTASLGHELGSKTPTTPRRVQVAAMDALGDGAAYITAVAGTYRDGQWHIHDMGGLYPQTGDIRSMRIAALEWFLSSSYFVERSATPSTMFWNRGPFAPEGASRWRDE